MKRFKIGHVATVDVSLRYLLLAQMQAIAAAGYDVVGISAPGPDAAFVESAGVRYIAVRMSRRFTPFADLRALFALVRAFRRERFDVIHTHTPKAGLLGQYAALLGRVPVRIHTIHGLYFPGHMNPNRRWAYVLLERITMLPSHRNLSQNPEDIPVAINEKICKPETIEFLGNGIDVERFRPDGDGIRRKQSRAALGLSDHDVVVGMVGRFVVEKGYREFIDAARMLKSTEPRARFVIVGGIESAKEDALDPSILETAGVSDVVKFLGHRTDLPDLYAAMDIVALPSYREGFPRVPMEAAAAGLPVVATDVRGCRQAVEHGKTGLLVPPRDAAALGEALRDLVRNADRRVAFGRAARQKALVEFDQRMVFGRVINAYNRLLTGREPAA